MRLLASVLFCLNLGIGAAGTVLDARFEAQSTDSVHLESERETPCTPGHAHDVCVLCRAESVPTSSAARSLLRVAEASSPAAEPRVDALPGRPALVVGGGPRAPPLS